MNEQTLTRSSSDTAAMPGPLTRFVRLRNVIIVMLTAVAMALGTTGPAQAASTVQAANCDYNYDTGAKSVVVRAPKIWSENGGNQSVRFRSYLRKWNGSAWVVPSGAIGQWHQGTATPNTPFIGPTRVWKTKSVYGPGYYQVGIQVSYYRGGWSAHTTQVVGTYHQMTYYSGSWHHEWTDGYCTQL